MKISTTAISNNNKRIEFIGERLHVTHTHLLSGHDILTTNYIPAELV